MDIDANHEFHVDEWVVNWSCHGTCPLNLFRLPLRSGWVLKRRQGVLERDPTAAVAVELLKNFLAASKVPGTELVMRDSNRKLIIHVVHLVPLCNRILM